MSEHTPRPVDLVELRDRIAIAAMQAILAGERYPMPSQMQACAMLAYEAADAMLRERAAHEHA